MPEPGVLLSAESAVSPKSLAAFRKVFEHVPPNDPTSATRICGYPLVLHIFFMFVDMSLHEFDPEFGMSSTTGLHWFWKSRSDQAYICSQCTSQTPSKNAFCSDETADATS